MKKFSVIIPVYNVEKYIRQCLDSVINQSLSDIEIICIDDKSTDNSLEILKEYAQKDDRIKIIEQQINQGQGIARNKAIDIASGEYIAFVDPDDFIELDMLEILYNNFQQTKSDIIQFDYAICKDNGEYKTTKSFQYKLKKEFNYSITTNQIFNWFEIKETSLQSMSVYIWDKVYKTEFIKNNNIKFAPNKHGEDHLFSISANLLAKKILYINRTFYNYRQRLGSAVNKASNDAFCTFENIELVKSFLVENNLFDIYSNNFGEYSAIVLAWHYSHIPAESTNEYLNKCKELLEPKDYSLFLKKTKGEFSILEKIFSLKNRKINGMKCKSITVLGLSFLIKPQHKEAKQSA